MGFTGNERNNMKSLSFAVPMAWQETKDYCRDCYFVQ